MRDSSQRSYELIHIAQRDIYNISREVLFVTNYFPDLLTSDEVLDIALHYANIGSLEEFDDDPVGSPADLYQYTDEYDAKEARWFAGKIYEIAIALRDLILRYGLYHDDSYDENGDVAPVSYFRVHSYVPYIQLILTDLYE